MPKIPNLLAVGLLAFVSLACATPAGEAVEKDQAAEPAEPEQAEAPADELEKGVEKAAAPRMCETVCRDGKACGDTCIKADAECSEPPGSACDSEQCCKLCAGGSACGDACLDDGAECSAAPGCACNVGS